MLPAESAVNLTVGSRDNITPAQPTKEVEISSSKGSDGDIW
jgi:hypothetical protein